MLIPIIVNGAFNAKQFREEGLPWKTEPQVRWAFRTRHETGLTAAFKRQGRKVLIDVPKYHELMAKNVA
jgi:hypothetical protein